MILGTLGIEKACEQWEYMQVVLQTWHIFNGHFSQSYMRYQICNKATSAVHVYWDSANHAQEIESQVITAYVVQALPCSALKDCEAMYNLTSIILTLYQILTQSQETILVLLNQT